MKKILNYFVMGAAILGMSAALASCQKENNTAPETPQAIEAPQAPEVHVIHVELDATVGDTKSTYDSGTKEVTIENGDQLYVVLTQPDAAGWSGATGTLTYDGSSFKGDITYTDTYEGSDIITDAKDLTATFLPNGYDSVNYLSATGEATAANAFYAGEKSAAVPQLVHLTASITNQAGSAKSPLTLEPQNAVLFYSITANSLSAGAHTVSVSDGTTTISGSVTAVADAATTFAVAFPANSTAKDYTLSISCYNNVAKTGKTLDAGKVVNITTDVTVNPNAPLPGVFSVSATETVKFSKGNLQLVGAVTWKFADNQWNYFGASQSDNHRDLFGWGTKDNPNNTSQDNDDYATFSDWGDNTDLQSQLGSGWRTLTGRSGGEWEWVLGPSSSPNPGTNCRTSSTIGSTENARYVKAMVHSTKGLIIFPDEITWNPTTMGEAPTTCNTTGGDFTYLPTDDNWAALEAAGCVFLPAAGYRSGASVINVGSSGNYWSSTPNGTSYAYSLYFSSSNVGPANLNNRYGGCSVRLVQDQQ